MIVHVTLIDAIAQAIYAYEGNRPPDRAYRNNNPGNLRPTAPDQATDGDGYRVFPSFAEGYKALCDDLRAKLSGQNDHGLGPKSTLLQIFEVYAPRADHNAPVIYTGFVAGWLNRTYDVKVITTATTIEELDFAWDGLSDHG